MKLIVLTKNKTTTQADVQTPNACKYLTRKKRVV